MHASPKLYHYATGADHINIVSNHYETIMIYCLLRHYFHIPDIKKIKESDYIRCSLFEYIPFSYPNNKIVGRAYCMILSIHSDIMMEQIQCVVSSYLFSHNLVC